MINSEEKAKVVAAVWGAEFIQLLAALLHSFISLGRFWRIGWIHPIFSNHPGAIHQILQIVHCKTASGARNSSPKQKRRPLPVLLSLSFFYTYTSQALIFQQNFLQANFQLNFASSRVQTLTSGHSFQAPAWILKSFKLPFPPPLGSWNYSVG